jgi:hypothetical protein
MPGGRVLLRRRVHGSLRAVVAEVASSADSIGTNVNGRELVTGLIAWPPTHVRTGELAADDDQEAQQAMTPSVRREPA